MLLSSSCFQSAAESEENRKQSSPWDSAANKTTTWKLCGELTFIFFIVGLEHVFFRLWDENPDWWKQSDYQSSNVL